MCSNGLAIREIQAELSDLHSKNIDLERGACVPARSLYDVSQALTWVLGHYSNAEERAAGATSFKFGNECDTWRILALRTSFAARGNPNASQSALRFQQA